MKEKKQAPKAVPKTGADKATVKNSVAKRQAGSAWRVAVYVVLMAVWTFAVMIVAQLAVGQVMVWLLGTKVEETVWTAVYSLLSYSLALVVLLAVTPRIVGDWLVEMKTSRRKLEAKGEGNTLAINRTELGLKGTPTWVDIGLSVAGFVAGMVLAAMLTQVFEKFSWFDAEQVQEVGFAAYISGIDRVIAFVVLVVLAPVVEEVIFRGWLYGKIRERLHRELPEWAGITISILVVSLLFGIVHGQWNVGVTVFALSVVLCGMREITGTIYAGILTHMIKNGVAFYILYVLGM